MISVKEYVNIQKKVYSKNTLQEKKKFAEQKGVKNNGKVLCDS